MLDVHAPHGLSDFFLHLFTITIGLLIALSLEGCVEWQHHRHLVREAEAALHDEIENNAKQVANIRQQVQNHLCYFVCASCGRYSRLMVT